MDAMIPLMKLNRDTGIVSNHSIFLLIAIQIYLSFDGKKSIVHTVCFFFRYEST